MRREISELTERVNTLESEAAKHRDHVRDMFIRFRGTLIELQKKVYVIDVTKDGF